MASLVDERGTKARPDSVGMTCDVECRYQGRDFTTGEMALLRALIAAHRPPNRHTLETASAARRSARARVPPPDSNGTACRRANGTSLRRRAGARARRR